MKETLGLLQAVNWAQVMAAVIGAFWSHSMSVKLGNGTLTATSGGKPQHLAPDAILAAAVMAFAGAPASITVGTVTVTFTPDESASPVTAVPTAA